jgi:DNA invertase Pin-like site-specific DNA recombinase
MKTHFNWAIYVRKSEESEERQVQSINDQIRYLNDIAKQSNYNVAYIITEAKSAKAPDTRPEFKRLLKLIEKGLVQGILCWKLDRLSRNPIDSARIQWYLQRGILQFIKASDRTYLPDDNVLLFAVEQGMANQYIRDLSRNVKRGLESKAVKGWYPTIPPIGYLNTKSGQKGLEEIIIDPERFEIVRQMWELMLTGNYTSMEVLRIATNKWKLDSPNRRKAGKKAVVPSYIYKMFSNIFYTGSFIYNGKLYKGNHKAMVSMAQFERMQILLKKKGQPRPHIHNFPFTGIMTCNGCGAAVTATEKLKLVKGTSEMKKYTYYHCTGRIGVDACTEPRVTLSDLENQIEKILEKYAVKTEIFDLVTSFLKENSIQNENSISAINSKIISRKGELEKKKERLLTFLINNTITELEYTEQKKDLETQIAIENEEAQSIISPYEIKSFVLKAFNFSGFCLEAFKNGSVETRRKIFASLGSNHLLIDKSLRIDLNNWFTALKIVENEFIEELEQFEPIKSNVDNVLSPLSSFSLLWCARGDKVRIVNSVINRYIKIISDDLRKNDRLSPLPIIPNLSDSKE